MKKKLASSSKVVSKAKAKATTVTVHDRTGKPVVVHGAGALAGSDFQIRKGVSLLKPIAQQAMRAPRLKAG